MSEPSKPTGPDLAQGIPLDDLADGGMLGGHVGDEAVLLARRGDEFFAIGATCTHYGGPLAEGLVVGDTVRCPWHHACFSLRTGEALARAGVQSGVVLARGAARRQGVRAREDRAGRAAQRAPGAQRERKRRARRDRGRRRAPDSPPPRCCGARASPAASRMLSADDAAALRPAELSKDYLAGNAPEDWMPLRPAEFYREQAIDFALGTEVTGIDAKARQVALGGRAQPRLRQAAARDRRRAGAARHSRAPSSRTSIPALARRQPRDHRAAQGRRGAPS